MIAKGLRGLSIQVLMQDPEKALQDEDDEPEYSYYPVDEHKVQHSRYQWSLEDSDQKKDIPTAECFIASEADKRFVIKWQNNTKFTYEMAISIDGIYLLDDTLAPNSEATIGGLPTVIAKRRGRGKVERGYRAFTFTALKTSKSDDATNGENIGRISATIYRCKGTGTKIPAAEELAICDAIEAPVQQVINEWTVPPGVLHTVICGDIVPGQALDDEQFVIQHSDREVFPRVVFEFKYRALAALKGQGILDWHQSHHIPSPVPEIPALTSNKRREHSTDDEPSPKRRREQTVLIRPRRNCRRYTPVPETNEDDEEVEDYHIDRDSSATMSFGIPDALEPPLKRALPIPRPIPSRNTDISASPPASISNNRPQTRTRTLSFEEIPQPIPTNFPAPKPILSSKVKREETVEMKIEPDGPPAVVRFLKTSNLFNSKPDRAREVARRFQACGFTSRVELDVLVRAERDTPDWLDKIFSERMHLSVAEGLEICQMLRKRKVSSNPT
ncbi:hypothetical protein C8J56DRAFT_267702 [Mycena floridula]|nr:hypothetical protein C8J56DRAFT_267702 [Mycena floridula]